jgi:catechol 2,3-dioxygenase-like lactoylglutathione lyase family enzyme
MAEHLHHLHLFTEDIDAAIAWWCGMLGGQVIYDGDFGGARNVFMRVGAGWLHLDDQQPRDHGRGALYHIGIRSDDLAALEQRLRATGVEFRSSIRDFGAWKYIMCSAPDGVPLELFEVDTNQLDGGAAEYFGDMPAA